VLVGGDARPSCVLLQVTSGVGMHNVVMDHGCRRFVDVLSALDAPPVTRLFALVTSPAATPTATPGATLVCEVHSARDDRCDALGSCLAPPNLFSVVTRDGAATLHGALFVPDEAAFGPGPFPTVRPNGAKAV